MKWNIPNILTVLRLLAAPGLVVMFMYFSRPWADLFALILFVLAAVTDWFDGFLARTWNQQSRFGAMLDPIADKVMVMIALFVITGFQGMDPLIVFPATIIVFREVFVSGLREFLGADAGKLAVTKLAKWKTTVQMIAIATLFSTGVFEHYFGMHSFGMDIQMIRDALTGAAPDEMGLRWKFTAMNYSWSIGLSLLWLAAALTLWTGWDYLQKSLPYLRDPENRP